MITISNIKKVIADTQNKNDYEFKGLSTDVKPTDGVSINSLFLELDTGDFYYYTGATWSKVGG